MLADLEQRPQQRKLNILVIDDDHQFNRLVTLILEKAGYQVIQAYNGEDGIKAAKQHTPDLIICDIMMPTMNGHDTLNNIRNDSTIATIPFIFMTAVADRDSVRQGMGMGADDYVTKPIKAPELLAAVQARLSRINQLKMERLQEFAQRLVDFQEIERQNLADTLQNRIHQMLMGLKLTLTLSDTSSMDSLVAVHGDTQNLLNKILQEIDSLALSLRPSMLDLLGLLPALLWLTEQFDLDIDFKHSNLDREFDSVIKTAAFRIIQESLSNVVNHAQTRAVTLVVSHQDNQLEIQIEDKGQGFSLQDGLFPKGSVGLMGMYERATFLGGDLQVLTSPGNGTKINVKLPLEKSQARSWSAVSDNELVNLMNRATTESPVKPSDLPENITIVIAESHALLRQGMTRMLNRNPQFRIVGEVPQQDQLLKVLGDSQPHMLVVNPFTYWGAEWHEQLKTITTQYPKMHLLVLSPYVEKAYVLDAFRYGATGFVPQNASTNDLSTAIMAVGRGQHYLSPTIPPEEILAQIEAIRQSHAVQ